MEEPNFKNTKNSISFYDYFLKVRGETITIDFENRVVTIKGDKNIIVSTLILSKSIKTEFDLKNLTNQENQLGEYLYFVFEKGYNKQNWLWSSKIVMQL